MRATWSEDPSIAQQVTKVSGIKRGVSEVDPQGLQPQRWYMGQQAESISGTDAVEPFKDLQLKRQRMSPASVTLTADCRQMGFLCSQPQQSMSPGPVYGQPQSLVSMPAFQFSSSGPGSALPNADIPMAAQFPQSVQLSPVFLVPVTNQECVQNSRLYSSPISSSTVLAPTNTIPANQSMPDATVSDESDCTYQGTSKLHKMLHLAIPQDAVQRLMAKRKGGKCHLQEIRDSISHGSIKLLDGDAKVPPPYRGLEISQDSFEQSSIDKATSILTDTVNAACKEGQCKIFLIVKKGEAGPIIGKGGQSITKLRQQFGEETIKVIADAKAKLPGVFKQGSGLKNGDDAIQLDGDVNCVVKLLRDIAPRLIRYQARRHTNCGPSALQKAAAGSVQNNDEQNVPSGETRAKKTDCVRLIKLHITNKQKNLLMAKQWAYMNKLRKAYPTAYLKLLDDPKEMKNGLRALEIGVSNHSEMALLEKLEAQLLAIG